MLGLKNVACKTLTKTRDNESKDFSLVVDVGTSLNHISCTVFLNMDLLDLLFALWFILSIVGFYYTQETNKMLESDFMVQIFLGTSIFCLVLIFV